jgi:carbon-monoxide dehydrogenase large subunit
MLYAKVLRSPAAHGIIKKLDLSAAEKAPGVVAVVKGEPDKAMIGVCLTDQTPMAVNKVRYIGEPVAAVIAVSEKKAAAALKLIKLEIEPLEHLLDPIEAIKEDAPLIHEELGSYKHLDSFHPRPGTNIFHHYRLLKGDFEKAAVKADRVFKGTYTFPHKAHGMLEPHGTIALWRETGTKLDIWSSAQSPFLARFYVADYFKMPLCDVRVIAPYLGGGFGGKSDCTIEPLTAYIARKAPGRPVRLVLTREEVFTSSVQGRGVTAQVELALMNSGKFVAARVHYYLAGGAYGDYAVNVVRGGGHNCTGPYTYEAIDSNAYGVYTNQPPVGAYRGYGHPEGNWMMERHIDRIAESMGIDPYELRSMNLLKPGDTNALLQKIDTGNGNLAECVSIVKKRHDELKKSLPDVKPGWIRGYGLAPLAKSPVMATNAASAAQIRFHEDGTATLIASCTDMGQGAKTVLTQIAAETLELPIEKIRFVSRPDTETCPYEWQTVASSTTWKVGNATIKACKSAIMEFIKNAALGWNVEPEKVEYTAGVFYGPDGLKADLTDLTMGFTHPDGATVGGPVTGQGCYMPPNLNNPDPVTGQGNLAPEWTFGCQGVVMDIDRSTGEFEIHEIETSVDIGRVLNPVLARGQVVGAVVQGLGHTVMENQVYHEKGNLRTNSFTDYKMPTPEDVANINFEVTFLETPQHDAPFGARPIAEHCLVAMSSAIANAVRNASGVHFHDMPLSPERLYLAMENADEWNASLDFSEISPEEATHDEHRAHVDSIAGCTRLETVTDNDTKDPEVK